MKNSGFCDGSKIVPGFATGCVFDEKGKLKLSEHIELKNMEALIGIYSTIEDWFKFHTALFGGMLLDGKTRADLLRPKLNPDNPPAKILITEHKQDFVEFEDPEELKVIKKKKWGIGMYSPAFFHSRVGEHQRTFAFSTIEGFACGYVRFPATNVTSIFFSNVQNCDAVEVATNLGSVALGLKPTPPVPFTFYNHQILEGELAKYIGRYQSEGVELDVRQKNGRLVFYLERMGALSPRTPNVKKHRVKLYASDSTHFFSKDSKYSLVFDFSIPPVRSRSASKSFSLSSPRGQPSSPRSTEMKEKEKEKDARTDLPLVSDSVTVDLDSPASSITYTHRGATAVYKRIFNQPGEDESDSSEEENEGAEVVEQYRIAQAEVVSDDEDIEVPISKHQKNCIIS